MMYLLRFLGSVGGVIMAYRSYAMAVSAGALVFVGAVFYFKHAENAKGYSACQLEVQHALVNKQKELENAKQKANAYVRQCLANYNVYDCLRSQSSAGSDGGYDFTRFSYID